jgi:hypothetical protein
MMRFAVAWICLACATATWCRAESVCTAAAVRSSVEAEGEKLTLADLLEPKACPRWRELAARVSLGDVPRAGSERVFDGREIRRLIDNTLGDTDPASLSTDNDKRFPERVVVRRAGSSRSCADIAEFLAGKNPVGLDCAAAHNIPKHATLELLKISWNSRLQRREYALRCVRAEDCVPFLVWGDGGKTSAIMAGTMASRLQDTPKTDEKTMVRLVKPGQTAILTWEHAGIRIVLPVTCLEAGGIGQFVRVRFPNASRTLRAEVTGAAALRASL